jgi:hypothetical protein
LATRLPSLSRCVPGRYRHRVCVGEEKKKNKDSFTGLIPEQPRASASLDNISARAGVSNVFKNIVILYF